MGFDLADDTRDLCLGAPPICTPKLGFDLADYYIMKAMLALPASFGRYFVDYLDRNG